MSLFDPPRNDNGGTKIGIVIPRRKSSSHGSGPPGHGTPPARRWGKRSNSLGGQGAPGLPVRGLGSLLRAPEGGLFKVVGQLG